MPEMAPEVLELAPPSQSVLSQFAQPRGLVVNVVSYVHSMACPPPKMTLYPSLKVVMPPASTSTAIGPAHETKLSEPSL
jgi:hypothetical protein